ncbi:hypothetical protein CD798_11950 [Bacillaceae bacterium SAOS 7]|nr:hypothetical protein CD798_11950 [Bacillaceae bacterium SAOS 7]
MRISEVMKVCHLTKKAIQYYEKQQLIVIQQDANGYRRFDESDVQVLKEIAIYRKLGISVANIKKLLDSSEREHILENIITEKEKTIERETAQLDYLKSIASGKISMEEAVELRGFAPEYLVDRLILAFPGHFGRYLAVHFGRFLTEDISTPEKMRAYNEMMTYLDEVEDPPFLEEMAELLDSLDTTYFQHLSQDIAAALANKETYFEENKETIEACIEYRQSQAFKDSAAYKWQQAMQAFQEQSGYEEKVIANMRILSRSYAKYLEELQSMSVDWSEKYPQLMDDKNR